MRLPQLLSVAFKSLALSREAEAKGRVWLTHDPEILHPAFEKLADKYGNALPALKDLSFSKEGAFSYSPELTDALGTLQLTGAISRLNPTFDKFSPVVSEGTDQVVERQLEKAFGDDQQKKEQFQLFVKELGDLIVEPRPLAAR